MLKSGKSFLSMLCFLGTLYGIIVPEGKTINVSLLLSTPLRQWSSHSETHLKKERDSIFRCRH